MLSLLRRNIGNSWRKYGTKVTPGADDMSGENLTLVRTKRQRQGGSEFTDNTAQIHVKGRKLTKAQIVKALDAMNRSIARAKEIEQLLDKKTPAVEIARYMQQKPGAQPDLTGVGEKGILAGFAAAMTRTQILWPKISLNNRLKLIEWDVNKALKLAKVPNLCSFKAEKMDGVAGYFQSALWKFGINKDFVLGSTLSDDAAAELCDTGMHESRHAEQRFLAACYYAGQNPKISAYAVAQKLHIPISIAQAAVANKFNATTNPKVAARGKKMYDAFVTNGKDNQKISDDCYSALLKVKSAQIEANKAKDAFNANPTSATYADVKTKDDNLKKAIAEFDLSYKKYRNIEYEKEAHEVGALAALAFKQRSVGLPAIAMGPPSQEIRYD